MMRQILLICSTAAVAALLIAVVASPSSRASGEVGPSGMTPPPFDTEHSDLSPEQARAFRAFPLYSAGDSFEGQPLVGITRRDDPPNREHPLPLRADFVNFIYGRCETNGDTGCTPPLEVQVWPACERNLSSYTLTPDGEPLPHADGTVRGVPAALFEDGRRLELYTGSVTVVLFGDSRGQLLRAASVLRGANNHVPADVELPAPAAGALAGKLQCSG
jgi:hypothetical protein